MRKGKRRLARIQPANLVLVKRKLLLQGIVRDLDATIVKSWGTSKEIVMSSLESSRGWPKIEGELSAYREYADDSSGEEGTGLLVSHALTVQASNLRGKWIVDSGATSHMCNNQHLFGKCRALTQHNSWRWACIEGYCQRNCHSSDECTELQGEQVHAA